MARPSPSPPCVRVVVLSACRNRSKIAEIISLGMPAPLSLTWICDPRGHALETDLDPAAAGRELHRVRQEVPEHLLEAPRSRP